MRILKKAIVIFVCMIVLIGCKKNQDRDDDLQVMSVDTKNINKIEVINRNIVVYPDLRKKDNLTLIEGINTLLEETRLDISFAEAEGYAQKDKENYYLLIDFLKPQTIQCNNNFHINNCDGILFDINNRKLNYSSDGIFVGTLGYEDNSSSIEKAYREFLNIISKLFTDIS